MQQYAALKVCVQFYTRHRAAEDQKRKNAKRL